MVTKSKGRKRDGAKPTAKEGPRRVKLAREVKSRPGKKKLRAAGPTDLAKADVLDRFWTLIERRRSTEYLTTSHSARLIARGTQRVAKKLGEEVVELVIETMRGDRSGMISEAADVLYHIMVLLVDAGIEPQEVWQELHHREGVSDLAARALRNPGRKLLAVAGTTKLP